MPETRKQPLAKRSPSILVTDVRNAPSGGRSAPFVKSAKRQEGIAHNAQGSEDLLHEGRGEFSDISIDNILSGAGDIPSARRRDLSNRFRIAGAGKLPTNKTMMNNIDMIRAKSAHIQARFSPQNLPPRTSKMSEKLVLIPDENLVAPETEFVPLQAWDTYDDDAEDIPRRSYGERMPKDRRTERFPRVTAYCISDGMRLQKTAEFLREHHKIRPRVYDEALFAPYFLPLLPGDDEGSRVKSSPGGIQILEQLIDQSEQGDHHYEYYSGLETPRNIKEPSSAQNGNSADEFDPYEPQNFSPRHTDMTADTESSQTFTSPDDSRHGSKELKHDKIRKKKHSHNDLNHAELFIFSYGVIVFWNFTEHQEKDILADLTFAKTDGNSRQSLVVRPISDVDIETEEMHFTYSERTTRPRIYNDMITLRSGDHMIKLAMSHAIAQSTKLSRFEARMDANMHDVKHVPKMLALTGKLGMQREEVLKISGKLFKLRVDVNLSSNVLDTPEFFWEAEPSLNPLYSAVREYLEIESRVLVLNERCKVFLELTDIISDSIAEYNMSRITWIIIILICLSLGVSTLEIAVRFAILSH